MIWAALAVLVAVPIAVAATSPLLQWRGPVYVVAGLSGVLAMVIVLLQPLLAGGYLPGIGALRGRRIHRWMGISLVGAVVVHVAGLWITSPPDVIDALTFTSATSFSAWGVIAMWAVFAAAALALLAPRLGIRAVRWRAAHVFLVALVVAGSVIHALLIQGTMGTVSKAVLCAAAVVAFGVVLKDVRSWRRVFRR